MERLTKRIPAANIRAVPTKIAIDFAFELDDDTWLGLQDIFDRLNEYEDTGLTPLQVRELHETAMQLYYTARDMVEKLTIQLEEARRQ